MQKHIGLFFNVHGMSLMGNTSFPNLLKRINIYQNMIRTKGKSHLTVKDKKNKPKAY